LNRKFLWGAALIVSSSVIGWAALFLGGALAPFYGARCLKIGGWVYAASWIPFGIGFLLAGKEGLTYWRNKLRP